MDCDEMMEPTESQLTVLLAQNETTLAEWWCALNGWKWPDALPEPEPIPKDGHGELRWAVMCWIDRKIGHRIISRTWNKDMPDDVFESFWRKDRNTDTSTPYGRWTQSQVDEYIAKYRAREDAVLGSSVVYEDILDAEFVGEE